MARTASFRGNGQGSTDPGRSTRQRILDAADRLFGERGFRGTSMRALTAEAGVNLAAVNYHFGSKQELLRAALLRHLEPMNDERLGRLGRLEAAHPEGVPVEGILEAFCLPAFELRHASPRNAEIIQRMAVLIHSEPVEILEPLLQDLFGEVVLRFTAALARTLPELTQDEITLRLHLCVGSLVHLILASVPFDAEHLDRAAVADTIAFLSAGFRAASRKARAVAA